MFAALDLATGKMIYPFRDRKRWSEFLVRGQRRRAGLHSLGCLVLNWIESEFGAVRYCTLEGSDYLDHATQEAAIGGYLRWQNKQAPPKSNFATGSKIRRPEYLPIAA